MKITQVKCYLCSARTSSGYSAGSAIIRVETDEGVTGHGESLMGLFCGETAEALTGYYAPLLIGENPAERTGLWARMFDSSVWWGRAGAPVSVMGAIDSALWDIAGKIANKPCYQLLTDQPRNAVPAYASLGPAPDEPDVERVVNRLIGKGFRALKLGLQFRNPDGSIDAPRGTELLDRLDRTLASIRSAFGDRLLIMVDGHMGGIPDPIGREEALAASRVMERHQVNFFEEPLSYLDPQGYAWLRARTSVRIAGGESLSARAGFTPFTDIDALDIVQPDVNFVGGIERFREVALLAEEKGLSVAPHSWCGGPGILTNFHMAFAFPHVEIMEMGEELTDLQQSTLVELPQVKDGVLLPPTAPGLGISFRPEMAERFPFVPGTAERASGLM